MRTLRGISAKFFAALARANINIVAIARPPSAQFPVVVSNDATTGGVDPSDAVQHRPVIEVFVIGVASAARC